jgi:hypothetical protein
MGSPFSTCALPDSSTKLAMPLTQLDSKYRYRRQKPRTDAHAAHWASAGDLGYELIGFLRTEWADWVESKTRYKRSS